MARPEPRFTAGVFCMIGLLIAAVSCNDQPGTSTNILSAGTGRAVCNSPQKITAIYKEYVYDLSGYADVTGPSAFALFDENYADPKSISDFIPVTSPVPRVGTVTYFKDYGNRIVVDLRVPYKLSEIYLYDRARQSDTVWIYTGTMKEWKLSAQYVTRGDPAGWGWRRIAAIGPRAWMMSPSALRRMTRIRSGSPLGVMGVPACLRRCGARVRTDEAGGAHANSARTSP